MEQNGVTERWVRSAITTAIQPGKLFPMCEKWDSTEACSATLLGLSMARLIENIKYLSHLASMYQGEVEIEGAYNKESLRIHIYNINLLQTFVLKLVGIRKQKSAEVGAKNVHAKILVGLKQEEVQNFWSRIEGVLQKISVLLTNMNGLMSSILNDEVQDVETEVRDILKKQVYQGLSEIEEGLNDSLKDAQSIKRVAKQMWKCSIESLHVTKRCKPEEKIK